MLVLAKLTASATPRSFRGARPLGKTANPTGEPELEPGRGSFPGTRMPHRHPEAGTARNRQVSANADQPGGARSHCLTPSPPFPLPSPSLLPLFIPPRVQPHREEWRPTPAGGAGGAQKPRGAVRVAHPRLERAAQPPVLQTQSDFVRTPRAVAGGTQPSPPSGGVQGPQRRASPQAPGRTALRTTSEAPTTPGPPPRTRGLTSQSPGFSPYPGASRPPPQPPRNAAPQSTCGEDAESEERLADHGLLVLGAESGAGSGRVCRD